MPENSIHPLSIDEWRSWLIEHHEHEKGVWLVSYKKATGKPRFDYSDAVAEALCFGWIDSKPGKLDDERSMRWFAPRKRGSGWSRVNKQHIKHMMEAGRMTQSGLAKIAEAKADGSWNALDAIEELEMPADLVAALAAYPHASAHFEAFPRSVKRSILEWIATAKRDATRAKRIAETAQLAERNVRANQWRNN